MQTYTLFAEVSIQSVPGLQNWLPSSDADGGLGLRMAPLVIWKLVGPVCTRNPWEIRLFQQMDSSSVKRASLGSSEVTL